MEIYLSTSTAALGLPSESSFVMPEGASWPNGSFGAGRNALGYTHDVSVIATAPKTAVDARPAAKQASPPRGVLH